MSRGSFLTIPQVEIIQDEFNKPHAVFNVQVSTRKGDIIVGKRFSDFRNFDRQWRRLYPVIPVRFPPKVWFGNRSRQVTNERRVQLKVYLHALCSLDESRSLVAQFLGVSSDDLYRQKEFSPVNSTQDLQANTMQDFEGSAHTGLMSRNFMTY